MGFDEANHQEPPDRAEYEAWEAKEALIRQRDEACAEVDRLKLLVDEYRRALQSIAMATSSPGVDGSTYRLDNVLQQIAKDALSENRNDATFSVDAGGNLGMPKRTQEHPNCNHFAIEESGSGTRCGVCKKQLTGQAT